MRRLRGESGQTAAEYLGLLTVVAAILALVAASGIGRVVGTGTSSAICRIAVGSCAEATPLDEPEDPGPLAAVGDFAGGMLAQGREMVEGVGESAAWAWRTATSADQRRENGEIWDAIRDDPVGALGALWDGVTEPIREEWRNGQEAAAAGRATAEIASIVVPGKLLAKLKAFKEVRALRAAAVDDLGSLAGPLRKIADGVYESDAGLRYLPDERYGNAVHHVLTHMRPASPGKPRHTVFSVPEEEVLALVDEAWLARGSHVPLDDRAYVVDMGRVVGTKGERGIRVVVREPGTADVLTAYPVPVP